MTGRVLDIDLDFFVEDVIHCPDASHGRPSAIDHPPWQINEALDFLTHQCGLQGKLPGHAVETHDEVFNQWRDDVARGELAPRFRVTHVDAHGDLGFGDAAYVYLMTDVLFRELGERALPAATDPALADSNYLAFAIAAGWLSELVYVYPPGGGDDIFPYYRERFNLKATRLQLAALNSGELEYLRRVFHEQRREDLDPLYERVKDRLEEAVPFSQIPARDYAASEPFDRVYLARSPLYAPPEADEIYDVIRERFIDESD